MYCTNCGKQISAETKFCDSCGTAVATENLNSQPNMFCQKCGKPLPTGAQYCSECGAATNQNIQQAPSNQSSICCPHCGSHNIDIQMHQENQGSITKTKTKSKYKEKGHGFLWWITIGWWWWIVDLCIWMVAFIPRLIVRLFKKKKYKGTSKSTSTTVNKIDYKSICLCKNCGHHWEVSDKKYRK